MAVYKVEQEVLLLPYKYLEDTGEAATPSTPKSELAVDERNKPKTSVATLTRGTYVYQSEEDFNAMSDEQKANSFYCDNKAAVNRLVKKNDTLGSLNMGPVLTEVEVVPAAQQQEKRAARKSNDKE